MSTNVLITGGTGMVGSRLTEFLLDQGYNVSILSRSNEKGPQGVTVYQWDIYRDYLEEGAVEHADYIVHLAGAGVADKRWTGSRKKAILESRTYSTDLLYRALQNRNHNVKAFVSASAIGIYGYDPGLEKATEDAPAGKDFLAETCRQWEKAVDKVASLSVRTVKFRIGVVLSAKGGALEQLVQPIRMGVGAPLGSGKQPFPWIHIDDLCRCFIKAIENENMEGVYNAAAPEVVTNEEITRQAANVLNKPLWLPNVPGFVMKLLFGEMANMLLKGGNVSSEKLQNSGFDFRYPRLKKALENLLA